MVRGKRPVASEPFPSSSEETEGMEVSEKVEENEEEK